MSRRAVGDPSAYAALVLGTRDYVRKCGFSKVVIGLSGGIDSALTAAIAVDALGKENVTGVGHAQPVFLRAQHQGRARAGLQTGHSL